MSAQINYGPQAVELARIEQQKQTERLQYERDMAEVKAAQDREKAAASSARMREAVQLQADQAAAAEAAKVAARAARADRGLNPTVMVNPTEDRPIAAPAQASYGSPSNVVVQQPTTAAAIPQITQSSGGIDPKIAIIIGAALVGAVIFISQKKS